jgi:hypothetical protein
LGGVRRAASGIFEDQDAAIAERDLCEPAEQHQALELSQQTPLDVFE